VAIATRQLSRNNKAQVVTHSQVIGVPASGAADDRGSIVITNFLSIVEPGNARPRVPTPAAE
jgi:hypothetical protein